MSVTTSLLRTQAIKLISNQHEFRNLKPIPRDFAHNKDTREKRSVKL